MPTQGWLISNFSTHRLHPMLGYRRPHLGIDVSARRGTPIEAPAAGLVIIGDVGWRLRPHRRDRSRVGNHHALRPHVEDPRPRRRSRAAGDIIALVGQSGLAEGPHLHYEVRVRGEPVDPLKFILPAVFAD